MQAVRARRAIPGADRLCPKCGARLFRDRPQCDACLLETALGQDADEDGHPLEGGATASFGDYELLEELGRGGQSVVYRARQKSLHRWVALKLLPLGLWSSERQLKRFRLEAEAVANLDHPRIVPIYEIGEREGYGYFSMKLLQGGSLAAGAAVRHVAGGASGKSGAAVPPAAAALVADLARTVHYAHQRGILHRDIQPGNILLDAAGAPHLTDFGLAKLVEQESTVTRTRDLLGTPGFMAPEQAAGEHQRVTTATDVYGLGAVLYFLLTGAPPFAGGTAYETIRRVLETEPRPPSVLNPRVGRDLEIICLKCLDKEPDRRYGSAEALADELDRYLRGEPIQARQISAAERLWRWCRRKPELAGSLGLSLLLLLGLAVGASVAALRIQKESARRLAAEQDARDKLRSSYLAQARASRASIQAGHVLDGLAAVRAAAAMRPSAELRDEAIALLARADLRLRETPPRARQSTSHVVLDASFERYATTGTSNVVSLRRLQDDALLAQLSHPGLSSASAYQFSRDGRWLTTSGAGADRYVWELVDPEPRLRATMLSVWGLPVSPDNHCVAAVLASGEVELRRLSDGRKVEGFVTGLPAPMVQFRPDGGMLCCYSAQTNRVHLVAVPAGNVLRSLPHPAPVQSVAWHPAGDRLACASGDTIYLWSLQLEEPPTLFRGHDAGVWSVAFHPGGEFLASSGMDGTTRLWEAASGQESSRLAVPGTRLQFYADGAVLSLHWNLEPRLWLCDVSAGRVARLWRAPGEARRPRLNPCPGSFSPDGRWLMVPAAEGLAIQDAQSGLEAGHLAVPGLESAFWEMSGTSFVTSGADGLQRWELRLADPQAAPCSDATQPLARLIEVLDAAADVRAAVRLGTGNVAYLRGDEIRFASSDRALRFPAGSTLAASAHGLALAASSLPDHRVRVWNTSSGAISFELVHTGSAQMAFSPDDRRLALCAGDEIFVLDAATGSVLHRALRDAAKHGGPVAFSPDGRVLAFAVTRTRVRLVEAETFRELAHLDSAGSKLISWLAFTPDSARLAVATETGLVQTWDLPRLRRELAALGLAW